MNDKEYIVDKLQLASGKYILPISTLEAIKVSTDDSSKSLKEILTKNKIPLDYELYSFKVNLNNSNPQTRISYFDMAEGRKPAFWDYTNGYFNFGDWSYDFFMDAFPCMVKYDGTIDYKLDPNNYTLKETGGKSDLINKDYEGSAMVAFPTIWIKRWQDDNYLYVSICNKQLDEDFHAYMHTNADGKVCKYKFVGMYFSTLFTDRYKSLAEQTFTVAQTFDKEMLYSKANGENWDIFGWSDLATIGDLLTLISKSDDTQKSFGFGLNANSARVGNTDPGKIQFGGPFFNSAALNTNSYQKIFHMNNLFCNQYTRLGGLIYLNGKYFVKPYPPYSETTETYIKLNLTDSDSTAEITGASGGFIKGTSVNQYGRFPVVLGGSATTYECDSVLYANNITAIAKTRGVYSASTNAGKLSLILSNTSTADGNCASRLVCFSTE